MRSFDEGLRPDAERVRAIHDMVRKRLRTAPDLSGVEGGDLRDMSDMMARLEYLLSKYQEKRDLCRMLEGIRDIMLNAAEGIVAIDDDISEMSVNSEASYRRIRETRLSMHSNPDPADRASVRRILDETSQ